MGELLFGFGVRLFDALVILLFIGAGIVAGYLILRRHWKAKQDQLAFSLAEAQHRIQELQQKLTAAQGRYDSSRFQTSLDRRDQAVVHELLKGLGFILEKSKETLAGLGTERIDLRNKQALVTAKTSELIQRARNIEAFFGLERESPQLDLANLRKVMEDVLAELFPYADANGVTLRIDLGSVEPLPINRYLVSQVFANVVHNAIKYSPRGGVVDVMLRLEGNEKKWVCVEVRDRGQGIGEKDKERIFELHRRADGLVEHGSGLGLYLAREIARLHGGDLTLVESQLNQGSTFRIVLPYR